MKVRISADVLGHLNELAVLGWDGRSLTYRRQDRLPAFVMRWATFLLREDVTAAMVECDGMRYCLNVLKRQVEGEPNLTAQVPVAEVVKPFDPVRDHVEECRARDRVKDERYNPDLDAVFT